MEMLVCTSDVHAGSTIAPLPREGLELDDGQQMMPSRLQIDLCDYWDECWTYVRELQAELECPAHLLLNGDLVDGWHHQTHQTVSVQNSPMMRTFMKLWDRGPAHVGWDSIRITRGTESHVGKGGEREEGLARLLRSDRGEPIVLDPDTGNRTSYWHRFEIDGVRVDARHHGRAGQRSHTKGPYARWYAQDIWLAHVRDQERPPDLAVRSHLHQFGDSGKIHKIPTRLLMLPAWQHLTAFGHRIAIEELGETGMVVVFIEDGEVIEIEPLLRPLVRPTVTTS